MEDAHFLSNLGEIELRCRNSKNASIECTRSLMDRSVKKPILHLKRYLLSSVIVRSLSG